MKEVVYSYEPFSSVEASSVEDYILEKPSFLFIFIFYYNI